MASPENKLIETDPPFPVLLGLVWGFFWRSFLWGLLFVLVFMIIGFTLAFALSAASLQQELQSQISPLSLAVTALSIAGWVLVCAKVFKQLLGKKFGGYRLVFLTPQAVEPAEKAADQSIVL